MKQPSTKKVSRMSPEALSVYQSLGVHVVIAIILLISVSLGPSPLPPMATQSAPVIQAHFIDAQAIADQKRAEQQAQAQARAEQERQRKEREAVERKRRQEAERRAAAEKARKKKAEEERRQQELKQIAAQKAKEKREREAAAKAEAERKRKAAEEKAAMDKLMQEQLEAEQAAQRQRRTQQVLSEVERYQVMIQQTIMRYLIEDSSFKGKRCRLNIQLASTGFAYRINVIEGDSALCREAESAVRRADKLPVSPDPEVFEKLKDINLTVEL